MQHYETQLKAIKHISIYLLGYGVITPKTVAGKLLVIPYALVAIPITLSFLSYIGINVSQLFTWIMLTVHKCMKGSRPLRHKLIKRCIYLFILFWAACCFTLLDFMFEPKAFRSEGLQRWLDGLYFMFVTYSTIGFGDLTGPANNTQFFKSIWFFFGLAVVSGLFDSLVTLYSNMRLTWTGGSSVCCCLNIGEDDTTSSQDVEL